MEKLNLNISVSSTSPAVVIEQNVRQVKENLIVDKINEIVEFCNKQEVINEKMLKAFKSIPLT